jgi:ribonuclease BN (tRNA processing enzyme)
MKLKILGCGDAFGSGGRFNTCFDLIARDMRFLVDCGASSMVAMRRFGTAPNDIDAIMLSHLHGDHFAGLPFFILDAQFVSRRQRPLTIAGPVGLKARLPATMEALFPGSSTVERRFALDIVEMAQGTAAEIGAATVTPFEVRHPSGAPSHALRIACDGKVLSYSGDTEWVEALIPAGRDADLMICECYLYDRKAPYHLDWGTLKTNLPRIGAKRVLLTHLGPSMLAQPGATFDGVELAEDGLELDI